MAIARCETCGCPDGRKGNVYSTVPRYPIGHPESGVICGTPDCLNPGIVWLTDWEETEYQQSRRTFRITGRHMAAKFQVQ